MESMPKNPIRLHNWEFKWIKIEKRMLKTILSHNGGNSNEKLLHTRNFAQLRKFQLLKIGKHAEI